MTLNYISLSAFSTRSTAFFSHSRGKRKKSFKKNVIPECEEVNLHCISLCVRLCVVHQIELKSKYEHNGTLKGPPIIFFFSFFFISTSVLFGVSFYCLELKPINVFVCFLELLFLVKKESFHCFHLFLLLFSGFSTKNEFRIFSLRVLEF